MSTQSRRFREIPRHFVSYLQEGEIRQPLPAWLGELAHYEWVELAVDTDPATVPLPAPSPAAALFLFIKPPATNLRAPNTPPTCLPCCAGPIRSSLKTA